jgi:3-keto-disaccharide hydrolase
MTRRAFVGTAAALGLRATNTWIQLFNGRNLDGWYANERSSWTVSDGAIVADGPVSHLFYCGGSPGATIRNFELEIEALAHPNSNSGVYFHTAYQEDGFPHQGFEVQINNTYAVSEGLWELNKTGSLYGIRNAYKQLVNDDQWFHLHIAVRGKNVQVRLNGTLLVDYTEPASPVIPDGMPRERRLGHGTFALQCHNPGSKVMFRSVRMRPLPDDLSTLGAAPVADRVYRAILNNGWNQIPMLDWHVHLKEGLTLEQALAKSRRDGIQYGIAVNCGKGFPIENDAGARAFFDTMKDQPAFIAMQAEGREWTHMFSRRAAALFDYVFTDSMTWTDDSGRRMRLWIPEEVGAIPDPEAFMEMVVARTVGILEREPIDIYVNPTFLPDVIAPDYDRLWTEERIHKVVAAAAANHVAIELNDRYRLPSAGFVRLAKQAGCKFTMGTNNAGPGDLGRSEYGLRMIDECQLQWRDFFMPGVWWPKAIDRNPAALRD